MVEVSKGSGWAGALRRLPLLGSLLVELSGFEDPAGLINIYDSQVFNTFDEWMRDYDPYARLMRGLEIVRELVAARHEDIATRLGLARIPTP